MCIPTPTATPRCGLSRKRHFDWPSTALIDCAVPARGIALVDAVDAQADQLLERQVLHAFGAQSFDVLRRHSVDAQRDQLIGRRVREAEVADFAGKFRGNPMNAKCDELVGVRRVDTRGT